MQAPGDGAKPEEASSSRCLEGQRWATQSARSIHHAVCAEADSINRCHFGLAHLAAGTEYTTSALSFSPCMLDGILLSGPAEFLIRVVVNKRKQEDGGSIRGGRRRPLPITVEVEYFTPCNQGSSSRPGVVLGGDETSQQYQASLYVGLVGYGCFEPAQ